MSACCCYWRQPCVHMLLLVFAFAIGGCCCCHWLTLCSVDVCRAVCSCCCGWLLRSNNAHIRIPFCCCCSKLLSLCNVLSLLRVCVVRKPYDAEILAGSTPSLLSESKLLSLHTHTFFFVYSIAAAAVLPLRLALASHMYSTVQACVVDTCGL